MFIQFISQPWKDYNLLTPMCYNFDSNIFLTTGDISGMTTRKSGKKPLGWTEARIAMLFPSYATMTILQSLAWAGLAHKRGAATAMRGTTIICLPVHV